MKKNINARKLEPTLISCLMICRPSKRRRLRLIQSLNSYKNQTYFPRELLILLNGASPPELKWVKHLVAQRQDPTIRIHVVRRKQSLATLRNQAIEMAKGDLLAQWDDDDQSHPRRLELQMKSLKRTQADAIVLGQIFHLFLKEKKLFLENWQESHRPNSGFPSSLLWKKSIRLRYQTRGPRSNRGEDMDFLRKLLAHPQVKVQTLQSARPLYNYVFHGDNQWGIEHHHQLVQYFAEPKSKLQSSRIDWQKICQWFLCDLELDWIDLLDKTGRKIKRLKT